MPPDSLSPEDPSEWLRRARSNLARASLGQITPDILLEDACFDAQLAVEKSLKELLVLRSVQVPRTHSISELLTTRAGLEFEIPADVQEASALTDYAVMSRYPGPSEPVLVEDYERAVVTATAVVSWASGVVAAEPKP